MPLGPAPPRPCKLFAGKMLECDLESLSLYSEENVTINPIFDQIRNLPKHWGCASDGLLLFYARDVPRYCRRWHPVLCLVLLNFSIG